MNKSLRNFRQLIGEQFAQVERGKIGWFPPVIFFQAMMRRMLKLAESSTSTILIDGMEYTPEIIPLVVYRSGTVSEIIQYNQIIFKELPKVLILHTAKYDFTFTSRKLSEAMHQKHLITVKRYRNDLILSAGSTGMTYIFKSVIESQYSVHSEEYQEGANGDQFPDILIYEAMSADQENIAPPKGLRKTTAAKPSEK